VNYFLRRLRIVRAAMPTSMPARIDSSGKPGIGGSAMGVETELVACEVVAVGVFPIVTVAIDVLTIVVAGEVLEVVDEVLEVVDELVEVTDVLLVVEVALVVTMFVTVVCCTTVFWKEPGGSRWSIMASAGATKPVPTAKPLVLDLSASASSPPFVAGTAEFGMAGVNDISVHEVPS